MGGIDFLVYSATVGVFLLGWWCRGQFGSFGEMLKRGKATVKGWFD